MRVLFFRRQKTEAVPATETIEPTVVEETTPAAEPVEEKDEDRRARERHMDGSNTYLQDQRGNYTSGRILDVSLGGARFWSRTSFQQEDKIVCRMDVNGRSVQLPFRVVWKRQVANGFEYGTSHQPTGLETQRLLAVYHQQVKQRAAG